MVESPSKGHKRRHAGGAGAAGGAPGGSVGGPASATAGGNGSAPGVTSIDELPGVEREPAGNDDERGPPRHKKKKTEANSEVGVDRRSVSISVSHAHRSPFTQSPAESASSETSSLEDNGMDGADGEHDRDSNENGSSRPPSPDAVKSASVAEAEHADQISSGASSATPAGQDAPAAVANGVDSGDAGPEDKPRPASPGPLRPTNSFEPPPKPAQADDLPPMVKLEPDFGSLSAAGEDKGRHASPPPPVAPVSSDARLSHWPPKEEPASPKTTSPSSGVSCSAAISGPVVSASSSSCPPPLDMSLAASDAGSTLKGPGASASGLHPSPYLAPPAHSGFGRGAYDDALAPVVAFPAPVPQPLQPEQSEPHNLKIKQELVEPGAPPREGFGSYGAPLGVASALEPKRELLQPAPASSPRSERGPAGGSKSSPAPKKAPTPTPSTPHSQAGQPASSQASGLPGGPLPPSAAHSLPYPSHFFPPGLGLPPQGLPISPYHQPGAPQYAPYGYPYPFPYHYPPMRMPPPGGAGPRPQSPPSFVVVSSGPGGFPPSSAASYVQNALGLHNFHTSPSGLNPFAPSLGAGAPGMHASPPVTSAAASGGPGQAGGGHSSSNGRSSSASKSEPSQAHRTRSPVATTPSSSSSSSCSSSSAKRAASPASSKAPRSQAPGAPPAHSAPSSSPYLPMFSTTVTTSAVGGLPPGYAASSGGYPGGPFGFGASPLAELQAKSDSPWNPHPHHALPLAMGHPHAHHLQPRSSTPIQPMGPALAHPGPGLSLAPVSPSVPGHMMPGLVPQPSASSSSSSSIVAPGACVPGAGAHDDANSTLHEEEEEAPSPVGSSIPRGPSPEPRIEDSECHRSQSAMYANCLFIYLFIYLID